MANEIKIAAAAGLTLYGVALDAAGEVWVGNGFLAAAAGDWPDCAIGLVDAGDVGLYVGDFPLLEAGSYVVVVYRQLGDTPAPADLAIAQASVDWDGAAETVFATGVDNAALIAAIENAVNASYAVLAKLGTVEVVLTQPVSQTGMLCIVPGGDYYAADGMALVWTQVGTTGWPDLEGASVEWRFRRHNSTEVLLTFAVDVVNATTLQLELSAAQTLTIPYTRSEVPDRYEIWATLLDGHNVRLAAGQVLVDR